MPSSAQTPEPIAPGGVLRAATSLAVVVSAIFAATLLVAIFGLHRQGDSYAVLAGVAYVGLVAAVGAKCFSAVAHGEPDGATRWALGVGAGLGGAAITAFLGLIPYLLMVGIAQNVPMP